MFLLYIAISNYTQSQTKLGNKVALQTHFSVYDHAFVI